MNIVKKYCSIFASIFIFSRNTKVLFNRHSKGGGYAVRLFFLMFVPRYFLEECSDFDFVVVVVVAENISASWWFRSGNFLNMHAVNLSACLFNILFGNKSRKNRTMARKFWYFFELQRFALHRKNCYCVVHRSFYRTLEKSPYINIY